MTKLSVLIVDDEPLARDRIRTFLRSEPDLEITGECEGGREALEAIRKEPTDIVLLDVQMPGVDGLKVLENIPADRHPAVILVTAHNKFAVDGFAAQVTDFLLKPFDRERFQQALGRAREHLRRNREADLETRLGSLIAATPARVPDRLALKSDGRVVFVRPDEIVWVEAANNYAILHLVSAKRLLIRETLSSIEHRLGSARFARVNRSALVQVDQVQELQPSRYGDYVVVLREGTRLPLSRALRGALGKWVPDAT